MKTQIIIDKQYAWSVAEHGKATVFFKGLMWLIGKLQSESGAMDSIVQYFQSQPELNQASLMKLSQKVGGHFSFIYENDGNVIAFVDKIRAYPVYFAQKNEKIIISNSAQKIQSGANLYEKDPIATLEFEMAGYTTGNSTLYLNLQQLLPGECLLLNKKSRICEIIRYYKFFDACADNRTELELFEAFDEVVERTFAGLIESLNGRPVYLPLSGGLDSRIILSQLKERGYNNLFTYTYGIKGLWEIKRAKYIADLLQVPWRYVKFEPRQTRKLFFTQDRENYYDYASGLNSIPHLAEYYALLQLAKDKQIPGDAVIINGQTGDFISGGHIPKTVFSRKTDASHLTDAIIAKHFSLWSNKKTTENLEILSERIRMLLNIEPHQNFTQSEFAKLYEWFEWQERQAKYVVNGQRAYEWLGYDWRLPLWSDDMLHFWQGVHWKFKFGQSFYKSYLKSRNFANVFAVKLPSDKAYMPALVKLFRKSMGAFAMLSRRDLSQITNKYSRYFMNYAPYYQVTSYREYLKDALWHRGPVSFWVKYYLRHNMDSTHAN